jgi:hypothetical protein
MENNIYAATISAIRTNGIRNVAAYLYGRSAGVISKPALTKGHQAALVIEAMGGPKQFIGSYSIVEGKEWHQLREEATQEWIESLLGTSMGDTQLVLSLLNKASMLKGSEQFVTPNLLFKRP